MMVTNRGTTESLREFLDGKTFGDINVKVSDQGLVLTDNRGSQNIDFNEIEDVIFGTQYDEHRIRIEKTNGDIVELMAYPIS